MSSFNLSKKKINHVAIIMDGNGRWAKKYSLPKKIGHEHGIKNCISICENLASLKYNLNEISFYVFSTENWKRRPSEIKNLFRLIEIFYRDFKAKADENDLRIKHYGSRKKLSKNGIVLFVDITQYWESLRYALSEVGVQSNRKVLKLDVKVELLTERPY